MRVAELKGRRIAVLLGGTSPEREVSLQSGAAVVSTLQELSTEVLAVDTAAADWWQQAQGCELAWICLHDTDGEDGTIQSFLQTMGIHSQR